MSERDSQFLQAIDKNPAQAAKALGKIRQSVYQGIGAQKDYFTVADCERIAEHFAEPGVARDQIISAARTKYGWSGRPIIPWSDDDTGLNLPVEPVNDRVDLIWFVIGDFAQFQFASEQCLAQFERCLPKKNLSIRILCRESDLLPLRRYARRFKPFDLVFLVCKSVRLDLLPFMAICEGLTLAKPKLFVVGDGGFIPASDTECTRVRDSLVSELICPTGDANFLQRLIDAPDKRAPVAEIDLQIPDNGRTMPD